LGSPDRPSGSDSKGNRGHRDVVCGVNDHRDVVLTVRVAASQYPGTDGVGDLLADDLQAVLRILDLRGQRFRGIGDLVEILWHRASSPWRPRSALRQHAVAGEDPGEGSVPEREVVDAGLPAGGDLLPDMGRDLVQAGEPDSAL